MIDMHVHTNNSDGTDSVEQLLIKAQNIGLEYISITDHDTCDAYAQLKNMDIQKLFSGKIIPGIEMKCNYQGRIIEILGYKINIQKMDEWLKEFYKDKKRDAMQIKYFNIFYENCIKLNLVVRPKEEIIWNPHNDWASIVIYNEIKSHKENQSKLPKDFWSDLSIFSKEYCTDMNSIWYIDKSKDYPSLDEAINAVKNAGGLVFLPHLFIYKWANNKKEFINEIINNHKIDGIECYHNTFNKEQENYLLELTKNKGMLRSGGSDYHRKKQRRCRTCNRKRKYEYS